MSNFNWRWYICRTDEIMCDLDSEFRLHMALQKMRKSKLSIEHVFATPSLSDGKFHCVFRLGTIGLLSDRERIMWAWWAGSDAVRALYNLTRLEYNVPAPDLLISPHSWDGFWRRPDHYCQCPSKHKGLEACRACPVFQQLHGTHAGRAYYPLSKHEPFVPGLQQWDQK